MATYRRSQADEDTVEGMGGGGGLRASSGSLARGEGVFDSEKRAGGGTELEQPKKCIRVHRFDRQQKFFRGSNFISRSTEKKIQAPSITSVWGGGFIRSFSLVRGRRILCAGAPIYRRRMGFDNGV